MDWNGDQGITDKALQVAEDLVSEIERLPEVTSIIFIGGLARGSMDRFSDLDLVVLLKKDTCSTVETVRSIAENKAELYGLDIDAEVYPVDDFRRREWDEIMRWDYTHCRVVFDPDGYAARAINEGTHMEGLDWIDRAVLSRMVLQWYAFPKKRELSLADVWAERGDLLSAHHCLSHSVEVVIELLFALNQEYVPPAKWKMQYLFGLPYLPTGIIDKLSEVMLVRSFSKGELSRRDQALRSLQEPLDALILSLLDMDNDDVTLHYQKRLS